MSITDQIKALDDLTSLMSSPEQMVDTREYARVKRLGKKALGPILEHLRVAANPYVFFILLKELTNEDPVVSGVEETLERRKSAWLAWGTVAGYIE